jgi:hypothetical protein
MFKLLRKLLNRGWLVEPCNARQSYNDILNRLRRNTPFSFSRWGDGEWEAVLGLKRQDEVNCDGHQYFDSMREELKSILTRKVGYMLGMQRLAYHKIMGRKIDRFFRENSVNPGDMWWVDADVFHDASLSRSISLFFDELKKKKVLLVGPAYLERVAEFPFKLLTVPAVNAWIERENVIEDIRLTLAGDNYDVVLFCAGMTTNWMVDQLHGRFNVYLIDVGSLLDPFAGKNTRNYHKKLNINRINRARAHG